MQTINQENIPKTNNKENGLKHGQFKITTKILDNSVVKSVVEHVVNPPSQEELVDGWQLIVPHRNRNQLFIILVFIFLSYLLISGNIFINHGLIIMNSINLLIMVFISIVLKCPSMIVTFKSSINLL